MVVTYSQNAPLSKALEKTFDGKHPCTLCKEIAKEKRSEKKKDTEAQGKELTLYNPAQSIFFSAPKQFSLLRLRNDSAIKLPDRPLLQPPRLA